jgi:hypothetical protein
MRPVNRDGRDRGAKLRRRHPYDTTTVPSSNCPERVIVSRLAQPVLLKEKQTTVRQRHDLTVAPAKFSTSTTSLRQNR